MTATATAIADRPAAKLADPNFFLFYVKSATASAEFYAGLLGRKPAQAAPTFAAFPLSSGVTLGLWSLDDVKPAAAEAASGCEIGFPVANAAAVDATHAEWARRGLPIVQAPTDLGFGRTFTALDPDGHRLRVFATPAS